MRLLTLNALFSLVAAPLLMLAPAVAQETTGDPAPAAEDTADAPNAPEAEESAAVRGEAAREWSDPSGRFQVEAELIARDEERVVLRSTDGELLMFEISELSERDRQYLAEQTAASADVDGKGAGNEAQAAEREEDSGAEAAARQPPRPPAGAPPVGPPALPPETPTDSVWQLRDGTEIVGTLQGFAAQPLVLVRREGKVFVNGRPYSELPDSAQAVVLDIVSSVDNVEMEGRDDLADQLARVGGGPVEYQIAGARIQLLTGTEIVVPPALLAQEQAELLEPAFARWQAAQTQDVSEEDRYAAEKRERLVARSYDRVRRRGVAQPPPIEFMQLEMLAAAADVTDIWNVVLYPPTPYGFPRSVVVPGQNSLIAQQRAMAQYPGWRLGPVSKLSL